MPSISRWRTAMERRPWRTQCPTGHTPRVTAAVNIDLEDVFDDPDNDTLTYEAISSDPDRLASHPEQCAGDDHPGLAGPRRW